MKKLCMLALFLISGKTMMGCECPDETEPVPADAGADGDCGDAQPPCLEQDCIPTHC